MSSATRQYTADIKRELRFMASWPPSVRVELGDVGTIDRDNMFLRVTSLASLGVPFGSESASEGSETFQYASSGAVEIGVKLAGEPSPLVPNVQVSKAGLAINFTRDNATVFRAEGAQHSRIGDQVALREEVVSLIRAGRWDRDWSIVTHVVHADSTTAIVGRSSGSGIELELDAAVQGGGIELLSASAGVRTILSRNMELVMIGTGGATPLFRAVHVKPRYFLFGKPELRAAYSDQFERLAGGEEPDEDLFEETPIYNGATKAEPASPGSRQ